MRNVGNQTTSCPDPSLCPAKRRSLAPTAHTEATVAQRATGILGSSLGKAWPFADVPTPTEPPGEHTVPVEWYQPGCALVLENRDGRQCPVGIHISLQPENSSKGAKQATSRSATASDTRK